MKARITGKSELRLTDLTRDYTFDIIDDDGKEILTSQSLTAQPKDVVSQIQAKVAEYEKVYQEANDVEINEVI